LTFILLITACQDDFDLDNMITDEKVELRINNASNSSTNRGRTETVEFTTLGKKRNNPFTVTAINYARRSFYGGSVTLISKTHTYVKFLPTTQDHLATLEDWEFTNMNPLFDFPLEYEVIEAGEHYVDPVVSDMLYTYKYSTIPDGMPYPLDVTYQDIDDLFLDKSDPLVLSTSFHLTGNGEEISSYINGPHGIDLSDIDNSLSYVPTPPDCGPGLIPEMVVDYTVFPHELIYICVSDGTGGGGATTNECGCALPVMKSRPAGCVQVENSTTQLPEAVISVTIKTKDNWFFSDFATTDDAGCWLVDKPYGGNMWLWAVFRNSVANVKDLRYILGLVVISDYVGKRQYPFNDNYVYYDESQNVNSNGRAYWAASHNINNIVEYHATAGPLGITLPRPGLNILNMSSEGASAAPMLQNILSPVTDDFLEQFSILPDVFNSRRFLPDIISKYGATQSSASLRRVLMHEFGHASHYRSVGEIYWMKYRTHIIHNFGYGEFPNFALISYPGVVALGEAYADFVRNQVTGGGAGGENSTFSNGYIPDGLMFDLFDTGADMIVDPITGVSLTDNISGFTPAMIDAALGGQLGGITDIRKFRDNLRVLSLSSTPNNVTAYNTFVDQYDVFN